MIAELFVPLFFVAICFPALFQANIQRAIESGNIQLSLNGVREYQLQERRQLQSRIRQFCASYGQRVLQTNVAQPSQIQPFIEQGEQFATDHWLQIRSSYDAQHQLVLGARATVADVVAAQLAPALLEVPLVQYYLGEIESAQSDLLPTVLGEQHSKYLADLSANVEHVRYLHAAAVANPDDVELYQEALQQHYFNLDQVLHQSDDFYWEFNTLMTDYKTQRLAYLSEAAAAVRA